MHGQNSSTQQPVRAVREPAKVTLRRAYEAFDTATAWTGEGLYADIARLFGAVLVVAAALALERAESVDGEKFVCAPLADTLDFLAATAGDDGWYGAPVKGSLSERAGEMFLRSQLAARDGDAVMNVT